MARWRDGGTWSASRISGPFLLYREIESTTKKQTSVNMGAGSMVQYLRPNTGP
ncbi:hypothetical protein BCR33DRAFT_10755 [Rhizoclosmatium globosum]|uniref:Uncharacterized protein n=1 Tax=Rhizoclosmatium globosum TaxID=329046 RepID=A0A1Y2D3K4_9FUNG|nr:hypothetical protein BCR33DRAFT_10755 [Rhizoclosmatium globosum]|eukprot:ORY53878.1 hypothetical protein BCR33DRAFT_10755 [Rhizoclosmatium globosum]